MKYLKKFKTFFLQATLSLIILNTASAEKILNKDFNSFKLALENNPDSLLFMVSGKNSQPKVVDLFELQNPNRIVLDVSNIKATSNSNYSIGKNLDVKKIRVGKHSQKVRFVLDIKDGNIPKFDVLTSVGNNLVVKLNKNIAMAKKPQNTIAKNDPAPIMQRNINSPQVMERNINPIQKMKKEETKVVSKSINTDSISTANESIQKKAKAKTEKNKPTKLAGDQGLENIKFYFKKDKKTPLVRFMFVNKPKYTIKKKDEKKYLLTIENSRIRWPHLELPQFPPRDFRGFTMIMPSVKNGNLEIVIGVERGSKVVSFTKESEVWLKVENYS